METAEVLGNRLFDEFNAYNAAERALQFTLHQLAQRSPDDIETALSVRRGDCCIIHAAARKGAAWVLRSLLRLKPELVHVWTTSVRKRSPLHCATAVECAEVLLDHGADIEAAEWDGATALFWAASESCDEPLVRLLLARGARVDATNEDGDTPLTLAARFSDTTETVPLLIDAGANVEWVSPRDGATALMQAAGSGTKDNVAALLRADARIASVDPAARTALHWAALGEDIGIDPDGAAACVELLLCAGASPSALDKDLNTPIDCALDQLRGFVEKAVPLLLAFDSPVPSDDRGGLAAVPATALEAAAAIAQRQLDALEAPGTLSAAAALLEGRLSSAAGAGRGRGGASSISSNNGDGGDAVTCPFAQLRLLRSGAFEWEEAWKHAPPEQRRTRFSGAVDRLAWAQALQACARAAVPAAAESTVTVLRQLCCTPFGSRDREKLLYAAARCVGKWWEVKQAGGEAEQELQAAEGGVAAACAQGQATLGRIRQLMLQRGEAAGGA